ncbi:MAG: helix-turn-helix domain-containing protein [Clostridium sp.]|nr:helix-turn-helix domain-containing protein [Clostridium sp.]
MAYVLGSSRASLFMELDLLQNREMISQDHGRIRILDRKELEDILYCCS